MDFSALQGRTLFAVQGAHVGSGEISFFTTTNEQFTLDHHQDCCERVYVEDITGDIRDLLGTPLLVAEERVNCPNAPEYHGESCTWTFYELRTIKGSVTIRWLGESNGYYSESVQFDVKENMTGLRDLVRIINDPSFVILKED